MSTLALFPAELARGAESTDAQCTPRELALELGRFQRDVCSNPRSHVVADHSFMLEHCEDGLAEAWTLEDGTPASVYANWPFSHPDPWCERLRWHNGPWCGLGKLDPTTGWFRNVVANCTAWSPFRARLAFERPGNSGSAEFPCFLVWGGGWKPSRAVLRRLWKPRRG